MKRFVTLALVSALVLGASSIVYANVCAFDAVPAATILFPFVTLDYNAPTGRSEHHVSRSPTFRPRRRSST